MEIINFDEELPPEDKELPVSDNPLCFTHPARVLIVGASGCGKTNVLLSVLVNYSNFDKVYLYCKDLSEPKYQWLANFYAEIENKINKKIQKKDPAAEPVKIAEFHEVGDDDSVIIGVNDLDPSLRNCVILDDLIVLGKKQKKVENLFIRGRKRNATVFYLAQSYYAIPKTIRLQATYLLLFTVASRKELIEIRNSVCTRVDKDLFMKIFADIANTPHSFIMIDVNATDLSLHIRRGFDGLLSLGACHRAGLLK